jgi:hypothetical protein
MYLLSCRFFVIFIVVGVMILMALFVGIIITSMDLLREGIDEEKEMWKKINVLKEKYNIHDSSVDNMLEVFEIIDRTKNARLSVSREMLESINIK